MKPITRQAAKNDVVRETMIQSQNVSAECWSKHTITTYNIAIVKVAKQVQCEEYPSFDSIFCGAWWISCGAKCFFSNRKDYRRARWTIYFIRK